MLCGPSEGNRQSKGQEMKLCRLNHGESRVATEYDLLKTDSFPAKEGMHSEVLNEVEMQNALETGSGRGWWKVRWLS